MKICLGLDSPFKASDIIRHTYDLVDAYKINIAFYLANLRYIPFLVRQIKRSNENIEIICDGKFGDVSHTSKVLAEIIFLDWGFTSVVVNPYCGCAGVKEFLKYTHKFVYLWMSGTEESNFQFTCSNMDYALNDFKEYSNFGLVIGRFDDIGYILKHMPFRILVPGFGAQGKSIEDVKEYWSNPN